MVKDLIKLDALLLENYKKLQLNESEALTLLLINLINDTKDTLITAELLSLKMSLDIKEIDKVLSNLLTRGFIEFSTVDNKTVTSLDPLKKILYKEFEKSFKNEELILKNKNDKEELASLYESFEKIIGRSLSSIEISKINEWFVFGYSKNTIIDALKEALSKRKKSIQAVDKILLSWSQREDRENEGHTPLSTTWDKNLEETIRIAKTSWIKDDDEPKGK